MPPVALLVLAIGAAILEAPSQGSLADALGRARPGDTIRLAAGTYHASLGRPDGIVIVGAGSEATRIEAPEGEDGAIAAHRLELSSLTLSAGPRRCALKVLGGEARLREVALRGGACALFVDSGRLDGENVDARGGDYGLLLRDGEVSLSRATLHGGRAGAGQLGGVLALSRSVLFGPSREAALSVGRGDATLSAVVIASPGPSGISVASRGRLIGRDVSIAGAAADGDALGDCVQVLGGEVRLASSELLRCRGAAVEVSGGRLRLDGVDMEGGGAGCIALVDGARAELQGNRCSGHGPGLVAASGSTAQLRMNRWLVDPVFWVECAAGARVNLLYGERDREPCTRPIEPGKVGGAP